jgi:DNA-binding CsgD family transcriptional regulator
MLDDVSNEIHGPAYVAPFRAHDWIAPLISSIGGPNFVRQLGQLLHERHKPEYVHIFRLLAGGPSELASLTYGGVGRADFHASIYRKNQLWRFDEAMFGSAQMTAGKPAIISQASREFSSLAIRRYRHQNNLGRRVLIVGRGSVEVVGISMTWSEQSDCRAISDFEQIVDCGFPIICRHIELLDERQKMMGELQSVPKLEANLKCVIGKKRPREIQVGARLLFGQSATEIALDLEISKETVITHRKRLYESVGVKNGRELLIWYMQKKIDEEY